jgi:hypothetical protein
MFVSFVAAQDPPKPPKQILKIGDVERFIKTFPQLEKDMESFNLKYEAKSGDVTIPEALKVSGEFMGILKKHGWDENFWQKLPVILMGYSSVVYGKEMGKADIGMEKSLKEIESNPNIPASMKKQLKDQLKAAKGMMKIQGSAFLQSIHPKDLELIKPYIKAIQSVIDKEKK